MYGYPKRQRKVGAHHHSKGHSVKKLLLGAVALCILGTAAQAADLPRKSFPSAAAPVPMFTWTGFYVGLNGGYGFGDNKFATTGTPAFLTLAPTIVPGGLKDKSKGFVGGAQAGYNLDYNGFVVGVETDVQFSGIKSRAAFTGVPVLGTQLTTSSKSEIEYFGTLRARLGFTPFDRMLVYATGGLAYGQVKTSASVIGVQAPGLVWDGSKSEMKFGWTLGAGLEYALTNNLSLKAEYLYYDLGKTSAVALGNAAVRGTAALNGIDYATRSQNNGSIVRAGINYRF
jgi:outer membrane immunogenic protein